MGRVVNLNGDIEADRKKEYERQLAIQQSPQHQTQQMVKNTAQQSRAEVKQSFGKVLGKGQQAIREKGNKDMIAMAQGNADVTLPDFDPTIGQKIDPKKYWNWRLANAGMGIATGIVGKNVNFWNTGKVAIEDKLADIRNPEWRDRNTAYKKLVNEAIENHDVASPNFDTQLGQKLSWAKSARDTVAQNTVVNDHWSNELIELSQKGQQEAFGDLTGWKRKFAEAAYGAANSAVMYGLGGGNAALTLAGVGLQAGGQKTYELNQRGIGATEAFNRGVAAGGIEILSETLSVGNILDIVKGGGSGLAANVLKQMLAEAGEEGESYILNYVADVAAGDPEATFSVEELAAAMEIGGLSGGMMGSAATALGKLRGFGSQQNTTQKSEGTTQAEQTDQDRIRESIQLDANQKPIVVVDTDQNLFEGADPKSYPAIARRYIKEKFQGQVLPVGEEDAARIGPKAPGEYAYPPARGGELENEAKMRASTELNNLLETAEYSYSAPDVRAHSHKEGSLGWDYYTTRFQLGGKTFEGTINIANSPNGRVFYDITKIREIPGAYGMPSTPVATVTPISENLSTPRVPQLGEKVNGEGQRAPLKLRETDGRPGLVRDALSRRWDTRMRRDVDAAAKLANVSVVVEEDMGDLDGLYDGRTNTLHISAKAQNPVRVVLTHEITHAMKTSNPAGYRELQSAAFQMMQETGDLERVSAMLGESYGEMTQDELNEELVAHFMQNTMEDIGQFERLIGVNRNVAQRLLDALDNFLRRNAIHWNGGEDRTAGVWSSYTYHDLEEVREKWAACLRGADPNAPGRDVVRKLFVGPSAQEIQLAERLEQQGKTREEIWQELGMFRGEEGLWRKEISDQDAEINYSRIGNGATLQDILEHQELYRRYPELANMPVTHRNLGDPRRMAGYSPSRDTVVFNTNTNVAMLDDVDWTPLETLIHETQHAIQTREGFAKGGSRKSARDFKKIQLRRQAEQMPEYQQLPTQQAKEAFVEEMFLSTTPEHTEEAASIKAYHELVGEQEAFEVMDRREMDEEERRQKMPKRAKDPLIVLQDDTVLDGPVLPPYDGGIIQRRGNQNGIDTRTGETAGIPEQLLRRSRYLVDFLGRPGDDRVLQNGILRGKFSEYDKGRGQEAGEGARISPVSEKSKRLTPSRQIAPELIEKYRAIPKGEHPANDVQVPAATGEGQRTRQTVRTALESPHADARLMEQTEQKLRQGLLSYKPISNAEALQKANQTLETEGYDRALGRFSGAIGGETAGGAPTGRTDKYTIALGERLLAEAQNRGDTKAAMDILSQLAVEATVSGQNVQAISMLKRMGPQGELLTLQAAVNRLNNELGKKQAQQRQKNGEQIAQLEAQKGTALNQLQIDQLNREIAKLSGEITLPQEAAADILSQTSPKGLEEAVERAYIQVAKQVPADWLTKWNALRYMSMLTNPTTHIRNILGNAAFYPVVQLKNLVKIPLEQSAQKLMPKYAGDPTAAVLNRGNKTDRGYLQMAAESFRENQKVLKAGGKYNPSDLIRQHQTVFDGKLLGLDTPFTNNAFTQAMGKTMEAIRKANGGALETEDLWFLRSNYETAFAQVLKANDYQSQNPARQKEILKNAQQWASEEAWRATYRDASKFADALSQFSRTNPVTNLLIEGVAPFKKTPVNILKRGVNYSPAGILAGVYNLNQAVRTGKVDAAHALDQLASGLTGSGIMALGFFLSKLGLFTGGAEEDKKKEAYDRQVSGWQPYALRLGDATYTLDWLAPTSLPFFTGVALQQELEQGSLGPEAAWEAVLSLTNPMVEMSMLSGLDRAIQSASYAQNNGGNAIQAFAVSAAESYFGQAFPTAFGRVNRILDGTQRNTYYKDKNSLVPGDLQAAFRSTVLQKGIPGGSKYIEPKLDVWGREQEAPLGERVIENLVSPGYYSKSKQDKVDKEVLRLYHKLGDNGVIPNASPQKYIQRDGKRHDFSAKEYTAYTRERGQQSHQILEDFLGSREWKKLSDREKAAMVEKAYGLADELGRKKAVRSYQYDRATAKAVETCKQAGITYGEYLLAKQAADQNGNGSVTKDEAKAYLDSRSDLRKSQKASLFSAFSTAKQNPYQ
nr:MAG TPA: Large polyvalent protein associated domain 23 [Caudoviricetes sp.]